MAAKTTSTAYYLVQFVDDLVYYVCSEKFVSRDQKVTTVKYVNRCRYPAKIICKNQNKSVLTDICENLNQNEPKVYLQRDKDMELINAATNAEYLIYRYISSLPDDDIQGISDKEYTYLDVDTQMQHFGELIEPCPVDFAPKEVELNSKPFVTESNKCIILQNITLQPYEGESNNSVCLDGTYPKNTYKEIPQNPNELNIDLDTESTQNVNLELKSDHIIFNSDNYKVLTAYTEAKNKVSEQNSDINEDMQNTAVNGSSKYNFTEDFSTHSNSDEERVMASDSYSEYNPDESFSNHSTDSEDENCSVIDSCSEHNLSENIFNRSINFGNETPTAPNRCCSNYNPSNDFDYKRLENSGICKLNSSLTVTHNIGEQIAKNPVNEEIGCIDHRGLGVSVSKGHCKRYYCLYCEKLVTNYGRHLIYVHKDKDAVKEIIMLPKGHPQRLEKITQLRRKAQFEHNIDKTRNTGSIIVRRRPSEGKKRTVLHYKPCPNCKEWYSKLSLRVHYQKCNKSYKKNERELLIKSRKVQMYIHNSANPRLVSILSRSKDDPVTLAFVYDELVIAYGNKLTRQFKNQRHDNMIRTRLREIGKFLLEFRKRNNEIDCLYDIFSPVFYDHIVQVINAVAGLDEASGQYRAPSTAYSLGLHLKSIALLLHSECIKKGNKVKKELVEDLISLMKEGFQVDINKTVGENQDEMKRHKKIKLPTAEDIEALKHFLAKNRKEAYETLINTFNPSTWKKLADMTLLSLQLFNRRRAGELETILIQDYYTYDFVDESDQVFQGLDEHSKAAAKSYARFFIRGKRNKRDVPVIISKDFIAYIDLLLKYRSAYGVPSNNPYVFGIRGETRYMHLRACTLMRHYSKICGAPNPQTLRGTELRKQIATACALYNLSDPMVEDIANHLGHHVEIHKKIYRQSTAREVPSVVTVLLRALGEPDINIGGTDLASVDVYKDNEDMNDTCASPSISKSKNLVIDNCESPFSDLPSAHKRQSSDCLTTVKRVSWTTPEKKAICEEFEEYLECGTLPTYEDCRVVQERNPTLSKRTPPQIKAYIAYQTRKRNTPSTKCKGGQKITWTSAEKRTVRREFADYLNNCTLPSLKYCTEVISSNSVLSSRTPVVLKAYVNNLNRKQKKENICHTKLLF